MTEEKMKNTVSWDDSDADIGIYRLMLDGEDILRIEDTHKYFSKEIRKPKSQYLLVMCIWGSSHSHYLTSESIEAAKKESETWLGDDLARRIKGLHNGIQYFEGLLNILR